MMSNLRNLYLNNSMRTGEQCSLRCLGTFMNVKEVVVMSKIKCWARSNAHCSGLGTQESGIVDVNGN